MADLLPRKEPVEGSCAGPRVVSIGEGADSVVEALRSTTARNVLRALYDEPTVASTLADRVETSAQNVHYHLAKLREADLVEVVGTWYSAKGVEMDVYAPAGDPLVLAAGCEDRIRELRAMICEDSGDDRRPDRADGDRPSVTPPG